MKKGFTLAELLGIIVIIALLLLLIVPGVINRLASSREEATETENETIYNAADQYIKEHPEDYPPGKSGRYCITIQSLIDDGKLTEPVLDVNTGEDISDMSVMVTIYSTGNTDHELKKGAECEEIAALPFIDFIVDPSGSSWVKQRNVTIIYPEIEGNYEASHKIDSGNWTRDTSADKGGRVQITFKKISKLEARLKGDNIISSKIDIINVDSEIPKITKLTMGSWEKGNNKIKITAIDNISGLTGLYISKENNRPSETASGWISISSNAKESKTFTQSLDLGTYYVWVKDKAGNISADGSKLEVKDTTKPTCTINDSGPKGDNNWYKGNATLTLTTSDKESGVSSYGMNTASSVPYNETVQMSLTYDTKSQTYYGIVKDRAGNVGTCSNTIKRYATKPTINCKLTLSNGSSYQQGTWSRSSLKGSVSASDTTSKVSQIQNNKSGSWQTDSSASSYTLNEGKHNYSFRAIDNAGNISNTCSINGLVDWTPPTVPYCKVLKSTGLTVISNTCNGKRNCSISYRATGTRWGTDFEKKSTDSLSGLKVVQQYWRPSKFADSSNTCNWEPISTCSNGWLHYTWDMPVTFDNRYRAIDNAGNTSAEALCTITYYAP